MTLHVEVEAELDGRWIAEIGELPGVMAYGTTVDRAVSTVAALALRVMADRIEQDDIPVGTIRIKRFQAGEGA